MKPTRPITGVRPAVEFLTRLVALLNEYCPEGEDSFGNLVEFLQEHPRGDNASDEDVIGFLGDQVVDAATTAGLNLALSFHYERLEELKQERKRHQRRIWALEQFVRTGRHPRI